MLSLFGARTTFKGNTYIEENPRRETKKKCWIYLLLKKGLEVRNCRRKWERKS